MRREAGSSRRCIGDDGWRANERGSDAAAAEARAAVGGGGRTGFAVCSGMVPRCQIDVLYFAKSAEIAGVRSETISVPQEIKASELWKELESLHPGLADVRNQVIFAVRQEYVELGDQQLLLQPGDEVAIIPPISGG